MLECTAAQLRHLVDTDKLPFLPTWLSFDNASIHKLSDAQLPTGFNRVPLSTYSPDIHKVIEHTFARLKAEFHGLLYEHCVSKGVAQPAMETVRVLLERALHKVAAAKTIAADQATLPVTLQMVATAKDVEFEMPDGRHFVGTGGNWARQGWR